MKVRRLIVILAVLIAVVAAICGEINLVNTRVKAEEQYIMTEIPAGKFHGWEFKNEGEDQYYALANNSYFFIHNISGGPVKSIEVYLSRFSGDTTEAVLYFAGSVNGILGEFSFPMTQTSEGLYTAYVDADDVYSLKIYPTENVRTTVNFGGVIINPPSVPEQISPGRILLWLSTGLAIICAGLLAYDLICRNKVESGWPKGYCIGLALVMGVVFYATKIFTAANGKHNILLILGFAGYSVLFLLLWVLLVKIKRPELRLAVSVLVIALVFCFASAPLQAPDEHTHFLRAWSLSRGRFDFDYNEHYPDDVVLLVQRFPAEFYNNFQKTGNGNALSSVKSYLADVDGFYVGEATVHTSVQVIIPYIPAAIGISLGRLFGANALFCMYLARAMNCILFAAAVYYALKNASRYRGALILLSLCPLTLFMVASTSYDSIILAALVLFFGLIFKDGLYARDLFLMTLCYGLIVSIKPIYLPLILLVFTIPMKTVNVQYKRGVLLAMMTAAALLMYAFTLMYASLAAKNIPQTVYPDGVNTSSQILYILKNPLRYAMVMAVDGYMQMFYINTYGLFGWLDVSCVLTSMFTPVAVVIVAGMYSDDTRLQKENNFWFFAATLILTYVAVVSGFYVTWSTLGSTSILGVQARYLLPVLPAVVVIVSKAMASFMRGTRDSQKRDSTCILFCGAFALISSLELMVQYFLT